MLTQATFTVTAQSACPCTFSAAITQDGAATEGNTTYGIPAGESQLSETLDSVWTVQAGAADAYTLNLSVPANGASISEQSTLIAQYSPVGPDGGNSLTYQSSCPATETEANNSIATANALATCAKGTLSGTDADYYQVTVPAGDGLQAQTKGPDEAGCDGDTTVTIYDSTGTAVPGGSDDDGGVGKCSLASVSNLSGGTYYIRVRGFDASQAFPYDIVATFVPPSATAARS